MKREEIIKKHNLSEQLFTDIKNFIKLQVEQNVLNTDSDFDDVALEILIKLSTTQPPQSAEELINSLRDEFDKINGIDTFHRNPGRYSDFLEGKLIKFANQQKVVGGDYYKRLDNFGLFLNAMGFDIEFDKDGFWFEEYRFEEFRVKEIMELFESYQKWMRDKLTK